MLAKVAALPDVASVASPYDQGAVQISSSGQIGFANVTLTSSAQDHDERGEAIVDTARAGAGTASSRGRGPGGRGRERSQRQHDRLGAAAAWSSALGVRLGLAAALPLLTPDRARKLVAVIALVSHLLSMPSSALSSRC